MDINKSESETLAPSRSPSRQADVRKLTGLWIGLVTYLIIMFNSVRLAYSVPYQILIGASVVNFAIITSIIVAMRRVYKRLREK